MSGELVGQSSTNGVTPESSLNYDGDAVPPVAPAMTPAAYNPYANDTTTWQRQPVKLDQSGAGGLFGAIPTCRSIAAALLKASALTSLDSPSTICMPRWAHIEKTCCRTSGGL